MRVVFRAGGWSCDLLVADCEDLERLSASEGLRQKVHRAPGSAPGQKPTPKCTRAKSEPIPIQKISNAITPKPSRLEGHQKRSKQCFSPPHGPVAGPTTATNVLPRPSTRMAPEASQRGGQGFCLIVHIVFMLYSMLFPFCGDVLFMPCLSESLMKLRMHDSTAW